jgi:hypothetical protein
MKLIRSLLLIASGLALATITHAQVGTATLISAKGDVSQVATTKLATLHDFAGRKGLDLNVSAFAGFGFERGKAQGGIAVSHRLPVSRELFADLGIYGRFREGRASDGGLFVGFGWRW